ncbi:hypothetical protein EJB05_47507 [Eragrostis curvula]|uniref:Uncharacterized protein n=1 Tax=Eragrostis curvula TaxID=38414 RepID=A0A5J9T7Q8_9POAL|nr:hypothetical protein EJB05_47507 [Eragrostis curvula]
MMAPPPPPQLMDELVEEVLLRLPPDDPASLVRAALVCRRWCRLFSDAGFRRRFRIFHRTPPMLGIYCSSAGVSTFVRTSSCPPIANRKNFDVIDVRHGRVLRTRDFRGPWMNVLVVCDPITDEQTELPLLPASWDLVPSSVGWNASVLCASNGSCDHLDCNHGAFLVVLVITVSDLIYVYTYSSEAGTWSKPATTQGLADRPIDWHWRPNSAVVGNALYVKFQYSKSFLKFDLATQGMIVIHPPTSRHYEHNTVLVATEDDGLGFAIVEDEKLYLWLGNASPDRHVGWAQSRVINFKTVLPDSAYSKFDVVGFAHGVAILFLRVNDEIFTLDLKSCKVRYICKDNGRMNDMFPYVSFCTPVGAAYSSEGLRVGTSCAPQTT